MGRYRDIEEMPDRLYAIGDIHGCADEAGVLLEHLVSSEKIGPRDLVLFIGDYVDRGMQSKQVLDLLIAFRAQYPSTIFLRGNHEDMFLAFLGFDGREGSAYLANGGANCVASYGVPAGGDLVPTREMVQQVIPPEHVAFLRGLERYVITEKFVFVHAGVNPLRDLRAQTDADLYWIRDEFIQNIHYFRKTVVFGHTPYENVLFHPPYKIGIDTGLVYGNRLSCIEVVQSRTLQVEKGGKKVQVGQFPK